MAKKRVYDLAKDLNVECKVVLEKLEGMKVVVKSHSSVIDDDVAAKVARLIKHPAGDTATLPVGGEVEELLPQAKELKGEGGETTLEVRVAKGVIRRRVTPPPPEEKKELPPDVPEPPAKPAEAGKVPEDTSGEVAAAQAVAAGPAEPPAVAEAAATIVGKPPSTVAMPAPSVAAPPKSPSNVPGMDKKAPAPSAASEKRQKTAETSAPPSKRVEVIPEEKKPSLKKVFSTKSVGKKGGKARFVQEEERGRERARRRRETVTAKSAKQKTLLTTPKQIKRRVKIGKAINVAELAKRMGIKAAEVIAKLMSLGMMLTVNQAMDRDVATIVATEFGYQVEATDMEAEELIAPERVLDASRRESRAPVVTVMGHVDHGKTSLLDAIRKTNVIAGEAGGITQAIGAYRVSIGDRDIVFLDTPGHEAFTAMRARGAKVTDLVVLVVAADDGVKETTVEAINHARAADVPILVAVNKIDKPNADVDKIKRELSELNLMPEDWGGQTVFCQISAKQGTGVEGLLEMILLQADMLELKANPHGEAHGVIIEAKIDKGRGPVATVLIQEGTIKYGDSFVSRAEYGRVRALINDKGERIKTAGPATPVEVIGFSRVPQVGNDFTCMREDKKARLIATKWAWQERERELTASSKITLEQLYQKIQEGTKELNVIIKGDVQGSVEAIKDAMGKLDTSDIRVKIIHSSTGEVSETDVLLASAANAVIIGFSVTTSPKAAELAQKEGVEIKTYDIIYNVMDDIKAAMLGLLEPTYKEASLGKAQVRQVFKISKIGTIAGCYVTEGKLVRNCLVRVFREGRQIYEGKLSSLKRMKDDAREVASGYECGLSVENFHDINQNDILEAYVEEKVERKTL